MDFPLFSFGKKEKEEAEGKKQVLQALKALRDGEQTGKVVCNLQGLDREIVDVVNEIVSKHQSCAAEMKRAATEAKEGREARVKLDDLRGTWLDIMGSTEQILQSQTEQFRVCNIVMHGIAEGDFSKKVVLEMEGEAKNLKNTINRLVDTLNCFTSEVYGVLTSIGSEGKFGRTVETPPRFFKGWWLDMAEQVNVMSTQMAGHFKDIKATVSKKAETREIEASTLAQISKLVDKLVKTSTMVYSDHSLFYHEIRTPLNGILGCSELLLEVDNLTSEQREMVSCMKTSATYLVDFLNDLNSYERLRREPVSSPANVAFSLRQVCERALCESRHVYKKVALNLDVDPKIPDTLNGYDYLFEQIILFITKFALAHNREKDVLVEVKQHSLEGEDIVLEININIPEVSPTKLKDLFSDDKIYGLEFPIALELVRRLKGTIVAENKKPEETSFTIQLPFTVEVRSAPETPAHLAQREVLVVCSHTVTQEVLTRAITWLNMKPVIAGNPDEALEILQRTEKDNYVAVLVDGDVEANEKVVDFVSNRKGTLLLVMSDKGLPCNLVRIAKPVGPVRLLDALINHRDARAPEVSSRAERILFAENNAVNQKVFARMLQKLGYKNVTMVSTGTDALAELENGKFDAILLGNNQDMFETNQAIRLRDKNVPIIAVTSFGKTAEMHEKFVKAGLEYTTKPVSFPTLRSLLSTLFDQKEKIAKEDESLGIEGEFVLVENK